MVILKVQFGLEGAMFGLPTILCFIVALLCECCFLQEERIQHSILGPGVGKSPWGTDLPCEMQTVQLWIQLTLPRSPGIFKSNALSFHVIQSPVILLLCLIWLKPQQPNHLYCKLYNFPHFFLFPWLDSFRHVSLDNSITSCFRKIAI